MIDGTSKVDGLTKRELLAAMAMQALISGASRYSANLNQYLIAADAVSLADALIEALNKGQS